MISSQVSGFCHGQEHVYWKAPSVEFHLNITLAIHTPTHFRRVLKRVKRVSWPSARSVWRRVIEYPRTKYVNIESLMRASPLAESSTRNFVRVSLQREGRKDASLLGWRWSDSEEEPSVSHDTLAVQAGTLRSSPGQEAKQKGCSGRDQAGPERTSGAKRRRFCLEECEERKTSD